MNAGGWTWSPDSSTDLIYFSKVVTFQPVVCSTRSPVDFTSVYQNTTGRTDGLVSNKRWTLTKEERQAELDLLVRGKWSISHKTVKFKNKTEIWKWHVNYSLFLNSLITICYRNVSVFSFKKSIISSLSQSSHTCYSTMSWSWRHFRTHPSPLQHQCFSTFSKIPRCCGLFDLCTCLGGLDIVLCGEMSVS